ncbi:hypothetical protein C2845_PM11G00570 [Panicum miliaceum]|uniref:Uncharacterized protein n=1 Tax=Panicum miliaceum TaxID=4540 RepID=A0A3L6RQR5_PANMI|nr:hypothetical protein C2845_PM11G00570 [Panicum miliaceum]
MAVPAVREEDDAFFPFEVTSSSTTGKRQAQLKVRVGVMRALTCLLSSSGLDVLRVEASTPPRREEAGRGGARGRAPPRRRRPRAEGLRVSPPAERAREGPPPPCAQEMGAVRGRRGAAAPLRAGAGRRRRRSGRRGRRAGRGVAALGPRAPASAAVPCRRRPPQLLLAPGMAAAEREGESGERGGEENEERRRSRGEKEENKRGKEKNRKRGKRKREN